MPLKITRAVDPVTIDRINMVVYGPPGISKTSVAFTAESPLLLDFDNGSHRAPNRKDTVRVTAWSDVSSITAEDLAAFKTVIVDTAGRALDALTVDIIRANPKHGRGGALTLQGYGELKSRFGAFLKLLNSFGKDVLLIAHMDEQRNGDDVIERLDVQGGSKGEIYKSADAMGRIVLASGQRRLIFSPTDAAFGKNPGQLDPIDIPPLSAPLFDGFLGRVIGITKDRLNAQTEAQTEALAEQDWFRSTLSMISTAQELNGILGRAKNASQACKIMVRDHARSLGLEYSKASGTYALAKEDA